MHNDDISPLCAFKDLPHNWMFHHSDNIWKFSIRVKRDGLNFTLCTLSSDDGWGYKPSSRRESRDYSDRRGETGEREEEDEEGESGQRMGKWENSGNDKGMMGELGVKVVAIEGPTLLTNQRKGCFETFKLVIHCPYFHELYNHRSLFWRKKNMFASLIIMGTTKVKIRFANPENKTKAVSSHFTVKLVVYQ